MPRQISLQITRNIGTTAHIDAGKTTVIERILYCTGISHKIGRAYGGPATMDWMAQEQERGITITSAATTCSWKGHRINIIGTPGHVDFTVEVERSLCVLDGSATVFCAKGGVEPQSETVWRQAKEYKVPHMAYINRVDIMGANSHHVVQTMKDRLECNAVLVQLPIGSEGTLRSIVGLVNMEAYVYYDNPGKDIRGKEILEDMKELAEKYHTKMVEHMAEQGDVLFEKYLNGGVLTEAEINDCIRKTTTTNHMVPATCGASYKNKGMQKLLDAIVAYMPAPTDIETIKGVNPDTEEPKVRHSSDEEPFPALALRITTNPSVGKLCFFRVYSSMLIVGFTVYNSTKDNNERIGHILQMYVNHHQDIGTVYANDIATAIGLRNTITGDILCNEKHPVILGSMESLESVIRVATGPKTKTGQGKTSIALAKLVEEDPAFRAYTDEEAGQTIIADMGGLHLEIIVNRLLRESKVETNVGKPQVSYKETIHRNTETDIKYARQSSSKDQCGHTKVRIGLNPDEGCEFVNAAVGGAIPEEYIPAVNRGTQGVMQTDILAGYNVVDVKVTLYDNSYHEVDSSEMTFKVAGSITFKEAIKRADLVLMKSIMKVVVTVPDEYMGDVIGDPSSCCGMTLGMDAVPGAQQIDTEVPLSRMFGYATDMRSKTQDRGQYVMGSAHYSEVPKSVSEGIISDRSKKSD